jgi:hypothetical protein
MDGEEVDLVQDGSGNMNRLILEALVRALVAKGIFSPDDVRAILLDAVAHLERFGDALTPQAARDIVDQQLAPGFLAGNAPGQE